MSAVANVGDVIAFEVLGSHWRWELGVVQAKTSERLRDVVVYKSKWAPMPKTARKGHNTETSEDEDEEVEADLDSTFVENKGKLRTILTSSIFYNFGNEDDVLGDDGHSFRLDASQQSAVEEAIKNIGQASHLHQSINNKPPEQPDILESTSMPKFKLNLPRNENEGLGAGYIAIPLPTGRPKDIMGVGGAEDDASANEKVAALTALTVEYEAQIASLIEQVEQLRTSGGNGGSGAVEVTTPGASSPINDTSASPRKVKIAVPVKGSTHTDPLAELAALPNDVETLRIQLKAATKQLSENRIKYEREMQVLKDKNTELQSVFEGWGAVAGTMFGNLTPGTIADLKNARETLQTARATYRKTARKSIVADASGENQLNAAEALLDLQQQMVNFISASDGRNTARAAKKDAPRNASASPSSPQRAAPKIPSSRPPPLPVGSSPTSPPTSGSNVNSATNKTPLKPPAPMSPFKTPTHIPLRAQKSAVSLSASGVFENSPTNTSKTTSTVVVNVAGSPSAALTSGDASEASPLNASPNFSSPSKDATIGASASNNPLNFDATHTASDMTLKGSSGTLSSTAATDSLSGTTAVRAKPKSKPKPKPLSRSMVAGGSVGGDGSPSSTTMGSMSLLSEFTRACNMMQTSQKESDEEVAALRRENEENAKKLAEMLTQIENMKKMKDKELAMLRVQIERLDAAAARKSEGVKVLDAKELVKEDISNMPSASPIRADRT